MFDAVFYSVKPYFTVIDTVSRDGVITRRAVASLIGDQRAGDVAQRNPRTQYPAMT